MVTTPRSQPLVLVLVLACNAEPALFVGGTGPGADETGATTSGASPGSSSSAESSTSADTGAGEGTDEGSSDGGTSVKLDVGGAETGAESACADGTDQVYLMFTDEATHAQQVYRFAPMTGAFELLGELDCVPGTELHHGLSVDRLGYVHALEHGYSTFHVFDPSTPGSCGAIALLDPPLYFTESSPFEHVFVAPDGEHLEDETIYAHSWTIYTPYHTRIDVANDVGSFTPPSSTSYQYARFGGTGDGRLFALIWQTPGPKETPFEVVGVPHLVQLDPENGDVLADFLEWPTGEWMAFYGGDLIVFERRSADSYAAVRYDLDDDDGSGTHEIVEIVAPEAFPPGFLMGAASPTCIPTKPPG